MTLINTSHRIKLISIDLDGTLLNDAKSVSRTDIQTLLTCKKEGYQLVFNTARPLRMIPTDLLNIFSDEYWILSNGTTMIKDTQIVFDITYKISEITSLIHWLNELNKDYFSFESKGNIFSFSKLPDQYISEVISIKEVSDYHINKLLIISEGCDFPHKHIDTFISSDLKKLITENGKYIQIMPKEVSKLFAVEKLCHHLQIDLESVLSFGDDLNDFEILQATGIGVAMANAHHNITSKADFVTKSNNESGVSHFINTQILKQLNK
ncbi:Cof-type HAD-IIB family hydrolase [Aquimarina sp. I32.4]|uniref:Cof-type HAD-IIB family hydrolase n=1 Tax=Aquimarina sp. I32.4 TaxID=2053903 RepID=UPI000CDE8E0D|nr:Cof-type HAD-IIB family hydrolase [Aquimarina sp. I32.4]